MGIRKHRSFTLIELIVAVGIIGMVLPAVFGIFFSMIRQQLVLIAYQQMKLQGDSAEFNIKNILQNRAAYITADNTYDTTVNPCPILTSPTPTYAPDLYIVDRDGGRIHLALDGTKIASTSADSGSIYSLTATTTDAAVTVPLITPIAPTPATLGFTCYRTNEFSPPTVSVNFTVVKSTTFQDTSLPYSFNSRLRAY